MKSEFISTFVVAQCLVACSVPAVGGPTVGISEVPRARVSADWDGDIVAYHAETGTQWLSRPDASASCQPALRLNLAADGFIPSTWFIPRPISVGDAYRYASTGSVAFATWLPVADGAFRRLEEGTIVVSAIEDTRIVLDVDGVFCDAADHCNAAIVAVEIDGISDTEQSYQDLRVAPTSCVAESTSDPDALLLDGHVPCGRCPAPTSGDGEATE